MIHTVSIGGIFGENESVDTDTEVTTTETTRNVKKEKSFSKDASKQVISELLLVSDGAKWDKITNYENDDYGRYIVYVEVRSQNAFGVFITNKFFVMIKNIDLSEKTFSYSKTKNPTTK